MMLDIDVKYIKLFFSLSASFSNSNVNDTWHTCLGYGQDRMATLARDGLLGQLANVNLQTCEYCLGG